VEAIGALEDRYGDQRLAVRCHGQLKKQTQGNGGSQPKLAAPKDGWPAMPVLHCARDVVVGVLARQLATASEDEAGDRSYVWEARRPIRLSGRPSDWRSWSEQSSFSSGCEKWVTGHCGGVSLSKMEEGTSKAQPSQKEDESDVPGLPGALSGKCLEWVALRREQREKLEGNHPENRAGGRKARPITDFTRTALGKE
jgi:hypothetical protein